MSPAIPFRSARRDFVLRKLARKPLDFGLEGTE
jgi:hypothetical protein